MKRILLIDDEKSFTNVLKHSLEGTGNYTVEVVNDSREAIEKVQQSLPDLIILDILMPHLDGGDIVKMLESDPVLRTIPVLVLTAMIKPESAGDKMVEAGSFSMLAKPVGMETLIDSIEKKLASTPKQDA